MIYIQLLGPLEATVADHWTMIWQERISVVVMLTNLMEDDTVSRRQSHLRIFPAELFSLVRLGCQIRGRVTEVYIIRPLVRDWFFLQ